MEQTSTQADQPYTLILAPNPSVMTGPGTNTIIVGAGSEGATVIDPAVDDPAYLDAVVAAGAARGGIRRILITHGHPDHIGGAVALRERLDVAIYAFSREGYAQLDEQIVDGQVFPVGTDRLRALHTPGHRFDHLCFLLENERLLFAGDLIAGVGTVVISPPEGDMRAYLDSLNRLLELELAALLPAHGSLVTEPDAKINQYIAHRLQREQLILQVLETMPSGATSAEIVPLVYLDVDPSLHALAAHSVEAHLLKLEAEGLVERVDDRGWTLLNPTA